MRSSSWRDGIALKQKYRHAKIENESRKLISLIPWMSFTMKILRFYSLGCTSPLNAFEFLKNVKNKKFPDIFVSFHIKYLIFPRN